VIDHKYPALAWIYRIKLDNEPSEYFQNLNEVIKRETNVYNRLIETSFANLVLRLSDNPNPETQNVLDSLYTIDKIQNKTTDDIDIMTPEEYIEKMLMDNTKNIISRLQCCFDYLSEQIKLLAFPDLSKTSLQELDQDFAKVVQAWIASEKKDPTALTTLTEYAQPADTAEGLQKRLTQAQDLITTYYLKK